MSDAPHDECKINVGGQWFYRGNVSSTWIALASRADGSASGISEDVPSEVWPILEALAAALKAQRIAELKAGASLANNLCPDHRDKQNGRRCLACLLEEAERAVQRYRVLHNGELPGYAVMSCTNDDDRLGAIDGDALNAAIDAAISKAMKP